MLGSAWTTLVENTYCCQGPGLAVYLSEKEHQILFNAIGKLLGPVKNVSCSLLELSRGLYAAEKDHFPKQKKISQVILLVF